jgi:hypothetical protein
MVTTDTKVVSKVRIPLCKCLLILSGFNRTCVFSKDFSKTFNSKFSKNPSRAKIVQCGRTDRQMDRRTDGEKQDKAKSGFVQLYEHVWNVHFIRHTNMSQMSTTFKLTYLLLPVTDRLILCTMFNLFKNDVEYTVIVYVIGVFYVTVDL